MAWNIFNKLLLVHVAILTICTIISANDHQYKRHIQANNYRLNTHSTYEPSKSTIINSNDNKDDDDDNNSSLKREKKISHGLMGGHIKIETIKNNKNPNGDDDDEEEEQDEAKWDDGLILSSAGNGKEKKFLRGNNINNNDSNNNNDDEKKTLGQQVKEGKYGLIQNEIYSKKPKRPGIISYLSNPDVPRDNAKNLGGLDKDDIWLAENHLLVLKGGNFRDHNENEDPSGDLQGWSPIDDYQAPKRQVRIPLQPKVPPPFPIQLTDNGPIKLIGSKNNSALNDNENNSQWIPEGLISLNDTLIAESSPENNTNSNDEQHLRDRKTKSGLTLGGIVGPFFPSLPPGAVFVPPPNNQTDYDEDDQSIYYPPPYSFKYSQDNSTAVPPGPLVPGIILPPPPDFFSQLDEVKTSVKNRNNKCPRCTTTTTTTTTTPLSKASYYNPQKSSTKSYKVHSSTIASTQLPHRTFTMKPINKFNHKTLNTPLTKSVTKSLYTDVTTPSTNRVNTLEISEINTIRPILSNNKVVKSQNEEKKNHWSTIGSNKMKPIVAYYPTTRSIISTTTPSTPTTVSPNIYEQIIEATPAAIENIITTEKRPGSLASYYFYEEANDEASGTTANPTVYLQETTQSSPYYSVDNIKNQQKPTIKRKPYYNIEITPSQQTAEDYSVEIIEPIVKTSPKYQFDNFSSLTKSSPSSRVQGQRMLTKTSPNYYEEITQRPRLNFQSFFSTTPTTRELTAGTQSSKKFNDEIKSKPVYQYSFEATNYSNQRQPQRPSIYQADVQPQQQQKQQKQGAFNEWQEIEEENDGEQIYDYNSSVELPERYNHERTNYRDENLSNNYLTSTIRSPIIDTTPNPAHAYYTKQDEQLLDDVTKEYFTNFGKKINRQRYQSTTPVYGKDNSELDKENYPTRNSFATNYNERQPTVTYKSPKVKVHYGDQLQTTYSLDDDIRVNYQQPLPTINSDAEYLPGYGPKTNSDSMIQHQTESLNTHYPYRQQNLSNRQRFVPFINYNGEQISQQPGNSPTNFVPFTDDNTQHNNQRIHHTASHSSPISLDGDIAVNYRDPRPQLNPDAEFIDPAREQAESSGNPSSYFAYRLPGDGGHVYFLTPHAISQRPDGNIGSRYLSQRSRGSRTLRRRANPRSS
ncbi:hypothetical protein PV325_003749 [Microctonus aethiopoides]|uniref:Uncharacterized protein n=1 Tax=Microctonus aethiopoides TaxID=144406 RepID=A0AA39KL11_9HYME|nr:hypothetical protein PV325_003749 [Microctonus aethiopoides]KAK0095690.1 hypothetical protein PV326_007661 [Microctonus aethiopoides]KAK0165385.1 hypothetical protein PV328_003901 [Microctonus aethiopoides]